MTLNDFEELLDPVILQRGKRYFDDGAILSLNETDDGYVAFVEGARRYTVEISFCGDEIADLRCDCPYEGGPECKHIAAVLYALRKRPKSSARRKSLAEKLEALSKPELIVLLARLAKENPSIRALLLASLAAPKDEISAYRALIRGGIQSCLCHGEVPYNMTESALQGAQEALEHLSGLWDGTDFFRAVDFALMVMEESADALDICDDSDGEVGGCVAQALEQLSDALPAWLKTASKKNRKRLFETLSRASRQKSRLSWGGWDDELFSLCETIAEATPALRPAVMERAFSQERTASQETSRAFCQRACLRLLRKWGTPEEVTRYMLERPENDEFCRERFELAFAQKDFASCLSLCRESERLCGNFPCRVREWRCRRFQVYEATGDVSAMRRLAEELLLSGADAFYDTLRTLTPPSDWPSVSACLLDTLRDDRARVETYLAIAEREGMADRLMAYVERCPRAVSIYCQALLPRYRERVFALYTALLREEAQRAGDRNAYRRLCEALKRFAGFFGGEAAQDLLREWQSQYNKRHAMQDEILRCGLL